MSALRPGYKQTEVGVIPEEWECYPASAICQMVVDCKNRTPPVIEGGAYAVVRTPNVRSGKFVRADLAFTDEHSYREWTRRAVPQIGDVLITREAPLGEVCLVPSDLKVCLGQRMMMYRPDELAAASNFLLFAVQSQAVQEALTRKIGGSTVGHARVDDIRNLLLPIPPLPEQQAIAEALGDADALIEALEALIAKKRALKQGAMQDLLTGHRRLPGFQGEWGNARIAELAIVDGDNLGSDTPSSYAFRYISLEDVDKGVLTSHSEQVFSLAPSRARRRVLFGDVLVSTVRPNLKSHLLFDRHEEDWVCSTGFSVVRAVPNSLDPAFLFQLLFSDHVDRQIEMLLVGSNYPAINSKDVKGLQIPAPTLDEQRAIAAVLSDMDAEIAALEDKLAKARDVKQGMMQVLLTGEIRLV